METWKFLALLAALFAGLTSILAKAGMARLGPDLALAVRTAVVCLIVFGNALLLAAGRPFPLLRAAQPRDLWLLALSGATAAASWICYYRAMRTGTVSFVALVDKGSIVVTLVLSFLILREPLTARLALGGGLILAGVVVLAWKT